ncbi:MAG: phosphatase PAP2 family protein [Cyanobacteria bacterium J06642_2]
MKDTKLASRHPILARLPDRLLLSQVVCAVGRWRLRMCCAIAIPLVWLSFLTLGQSSFAFESQWLEWLDVHVPGWLKAFTSLTFYAGNSEVSAVVVAIALVLLARQKRWLDLGTLAIAAAGSLIWVDWVFKPWFAKDRPPLSHIEAIAGDAFPSGHATGNLMLYLFLAYLLSEHFPRWRGLFYGLAIALLLAMGLGSMVLRAHWPTDVLAGYGFGFIWLTACLGVMRWLKCASSAAAERG